MDFSNYFGIFGAYKYSIIKFHFIQKIQVN